MKNEEAVRASLERLRASGVQPGQKFQHYATKTIYLVTAVGLYEPDVEPLVHYRDAADEHAIVWSRQLHVFCGQAIVEGAFVQRYVQVE